VRDPITRESRPGLRIHKWHGLEVVGTTDGGPKDDKGEVEFIAHFRDKDGIRNHHEHGQFERKKKKGGNGRALSLLPEAT
jgi:SEC-C motif-containing protein